MALMNSHRSGSLLTLCLILLLSIVFLAPLYHSHNHTGDYHQGCSGDHVLLQAGSCNKGLSANQQHNGSHMHIKKDIGRTDTRLSFNSDTLEPDLCVVTESPIFTEHISCTFAKHTKPLIFRYNSRACLSGLAPPTA